MKIRLGQVLMNDVVVHKNIQDIRGNGFGDDFPVEQLLDAGMIIDLSFKNSIFIEVNKHIHQHFRCPVKPFFKRPGAPYFLDKPGTLPGDIGSGQGFVISHVFFVTHDQTGCNGIPQGTDTNLQGAIVPYQAADIQANHMIGRG